MKGEVVPLLPLEVAFDELLDPDLVEYVAAALHSARWRTTRWSELSAEDRRLYRADARAALGAMVARQKR